MAVKRQNACSLPTTTMATKRRKSSQQQRLRVSVSNLPQDILINILAKLPATTLLQCKRVCKEWNQTISSPVFAELHYEITSRLNPNHILLSCKEMCSPELNIVAECCYTRQGGYKLKSSKLGVGGFTSHDDFQVVNSCRGLLLLRSEFRFDDYDCAYNEFSADYFVFNPITKEQVSLPRVIGAAPCFCGLGFSPSTKEFKVVRLLYLKSGHQIETCTIGKSMEWRRTLMKDSSQDILDKIRFEGDANPLQLNGVFHWLAMGDRIACFNIEEEELDVMHSPCVEEAGKWVVSIGAVGGQLCLGITLLGNSRHGVEMWIMKEYGIKESWTKHVVINNPVNKDKELFKPKFLEILDNGEIVFIHACGGLFVYYPKKRCFKRLQIPGFRSFTGAQSYVPSFLSIGTSCT